jgi:hypothetical protein
LWTDLGTKVQRATALLRLALAVGAVDAAAAVAQLQALAALPVDGEAFVAYAAPMADCVATLKQTRRFTDSAVAALSNEVYNRWKSAASASAAAAPASAAPAAAAPAEAAHQ